MLRCSFIISATLIVSIAALAGENEDSEPFIETTGPVPNEYYSYEDVVSTLASLAAGRPDICRLGTAGVSDYFGLPIPMITFGRHIDERDQPCVLVTGGTHSREVVGVFAAMALCTALVERDGWDPMTTAILDSTRVVVIPMVNVDGAVYVFEGHLPSPWWRKNLSDNDGGGFSPATDGVDVNRNYDRYWAYGDTGFSSWYYRGEAPFSEAESRAVRDVALLEIPSFGISYHSYDEAVYYPRTVGGAPTPDDDVYTAFALGLASRLVRHAGGAYITARQGPKGFSSQWLYSGVGCFDFTVEIGTEHVPQFEVAFWDVAQHLEAALWLCESARHTGVMGRATDAETGEPIACNIVVAGRTADGDSPRRNDPETGYFHRPLPIGDHRVRFSAAGYDTLALRVVVPLSGHAVYDVSLYHTTSVDQPGHTGVLPPTITASPNPTNSSVRVAFTLPEPARVRVDVVDVLGRVVATIVDGVLSDGEHVARWDARQVPSGIYTVSLAAGDSRATTRVAVLK